MTRRAKYAKSPVQRYVLYLKNQVKLKAHFQIMKVYSHSISKHHGCRHAIILACNGLCSERSNFMSSMLLLLMTHTGNNEIIEGYQLPGLCKLCQSFTILGKPYRPIKVMAFQ